MHWPESERNNSSQDAKTAAGTDIAVKHIDARLWNSSGAKGRSHVSQVFPLHPFHDLGIPNSDEALRSKLPRTHGFLAIKTGQPKSMQCLATSYLDIEHTTSRQNEANISRLV